MKTRFAPALGAFAAVLVATPVQACPVCFGAPGSQDTEALSWAILFLLSVLAVVMGGVAAFIRHLARGDGNAASAQPTISHAE